MINEEIKMQSIILYPLSTSVLNIKRLNVDTKFFSGK